MSIKLLVRPNPFPDESLIGYIIRLGESNGYESPSDIVNLAENSPYRYSSDLHKAFHYNLLPFSKLLQKDFSSFTFLFNTPLNNLADERLAYKIKSELVQFFYLRVCPLCLRESPYYRAMWDLKLITVCPIHKCMLVSSCPDCHQKISIRRNQVVKCICGFDLRETQDSAPLPDEELCVASHIYSQLGIENFDLVPVPEHNPLINFSLNEFSAFINCFSKLALRLFNSKNDSNIKVSRMHICHKSICQALSIFDDFPKNYVAFVTNQIAEANSTKSRHNNASFGRYNPRMYLCLPQTAWTFLYKTFTEKINPLLENSTVTFRRRVYIPEDKYIPISEAEKHLKIRKDEFQYLIASKQLRTEFLDFNQRKTWLVESNHFINLKLEKETWIRDADLASQLAISNQIVKQLACKKYIPIRTKGYSNNEVHYFFDGDLFINLFSKIRSGIKKKQKIDKSLLLDFARIEQLFNHDIMILSEFLGFCFQGQIKPTLELLGKKGVHRFLFTEKDIEIFKMEVVSAKIDLERNT